MEAETQRQLSEKEHQKSAAVFETAKQKVLSLLLGKIIRVTHRNLFVFAVSIP